MPTVMPDITPGTASTPTRLRLCLYGPVDSLPSGKCVKSYVDSVLANGCMLWLASWHHSIGVHGWPAGGRLGLSPLDVEAGTTPAALACQVRRRLRGVLISGRNPEERF